MIIYEESNFFVNIDVLKKIAIHSDINYKHAAALIHNTNIYSFGINKFIAKINKNKTIHAEINVFYNLPKKHIKGLDIVVIRINNKLFLKNSRPCNNCIDKLKKLGIRKIFYSNEYGQIICEYIEHMKKIHLSSGNK